MEVYVLTLVHPTKGVIDVMGVYSKPKEARKAFDNYFGIYTKHQWSKVTNGVRKFNEYMIISYKVDGGLESDE